MLSAQIVAELNDQLAREATASNNYLAMASWCEGAQLVGCAGFFYAQAEEEREHMLKIFKYINANGGKAVLAQQEVPRADFPDIKEVFSTALKQEQAVTKAIYQLVGVCEQQKAYATYKFLQWYVEEQQEEERLFTFILDQINLIGVDGRGLYFIDCMVKKAREDGVESVEE